MPLAKLQNAIDSVSETEVKAITILAGKMFDSQAATLRHNVLLTVSAGTGLVVAVDTFEDDPAWLAQRGVDLTDEAATIDLRGLTVLPGFVDAHVHRESHVHLRKMTMVDERASVPPSVLRDQLGGPGYARESRRAHRPRDAARARHVDGGLHRRTVRRPSRYAPPSPAEPIYTLSDLGTEGAQDADIALRRCLSGPNPIMPGPRYFVANRAIVATGSYGVCFVVEAKCKVDVDMQARKTGCVPTERVSKVCLVPRLLMVKSRASRPFGGRLELGQIGSR